MAPLTEDEYTPRDRGLLVGSDFADRVAKGKVVLHEYEDSPPIPPAEALEKMAAGTPHVPDDLRRILIEAGIMDRLAESEDRDAGSAFWGGFRDGVRARIIELQRGLGPN